MNGLDRPAAAAPVGASEIRERLDRGETPDAAAVLAQHPELLEDKSLVLDLAYEEYCARADAGEPPELEAFCARFPAYRSSLRHLLATHEYLALKSSLLGSAPPKRWPQPGERFGDFALLRELGRGAFARVYLATEASTGDRPVVVKLSFAGSAEAQTLGRLNHPNIVPILSAHLDATSGLTAVCMPFSGAATLTDVLDRAYRKPGDAPPRRASVFLESINASSRPGDPPLEAPPPDRRFLRGNYEEGVALVALDLAEALAFLHARQVFHLDLKPSNVLFGSNGRPMLLDFNLSADARNARAQPGGTLPYMAPEQVEALAAEAPAAHAPNGGCDVFSLGVMLYELLTGTLPFGTLPPLPLRQLAAQLLERQRTEYRPVRKVAPRTSRRLAMLVDRCLAFDPADRPASATAVAASLRRFLAGKRRSRLGRWCASLALVGAIAIAAFAAVPRPPGLAERGRTAFRAGDFAEAGRCFEQALAANPADTNSRWSQAITRLKLSEATTPDEARKYIRLAVEDLPAADADHPIPETRANLGYCFSRRAQHAEAIFEYNAAEAGGFKSAALYNDRAFSRLCINEPDAAEVDLTRALALDPELAAAYYNRAFLAISRWLRAADPRVAAAGRDDAVRAIALGVRSPELYFDAACLTIAAGGTNAPEEALGYLESAVDWGKDPSAFVAFAPFKQSLSKHPGYQALLKRRPTRQRLAGTARLVLPVSSLRD